MNEAQLPQGSTENTLCQISQGASQNISLYNEKRPTYKKLHHNWWVKEDLPFRASTAQPFFVWTEPSESLIMVLHWHWWPRWSWGVSAPTKGRTVGTQAKFRTVEHRVTAERWNINVWGRKSFCHTNRDHLPYIPQSSPWNFFLRFLHFELDWTRITKVPSPWPLHEPQLNLCSGVIRDEEESSLTERLSSGGERHNTLFQCDCLKDSPVSCSSPALHGFCSAPWSWWRLRRRWRGPGTLLPQQQEQQQSPSPSPSEPVGPAAPGPGPAPAQTSRETQLTEFRPLKEMVKPSHRKGKPMN